jgi:pentatricopeptide repeat domain-containing protein 1
MFHSMKDHGLKPNVITFSATISACEKGGQWKKALELFHSMKGHGVKPSVITFSAAISACEKGGKWEKALELFHWMKNHGVKPNEITFSAAISACEKGGQWKKALELFHSMKDHGVRPNVITFSACIEALHAASRFEEAVDFMTIARSQGFYSSAWRSASKVDLHDCSVAVAQTIMRLFLSELKSGNRSPIEVVIITGRGIGSGEKGAVLPQEVRSFLIENDGPKSTEVPRNPGCFVLTKESILKWLD